MCFSTSDCLFFFVTSYFSVAFFLSYATYLPLFFNFFSSSSILQQCLSGWLVGSLTFILVLYIKQIWIYYGPTYIYKYSISLKSYRTKLWDYEHVLILLGFITNQIIHLKVFSADSWKIINLLSEKILFLLSINSYLYLNLSVLLISSNPCWYLYEFPNI